MTELDFLLGWLLLTIVLFKLALYIKDIPRLYTIKKNAISCAGLMGIKKMINVLEAVTDGCNIESIGDEDNPLSVIYSGVLKYKFKDKDIMEAFSFIIIIGDKANIMKAMITDNSRNKHNVIHIDMIKALTTNPDHFYKTLSKKKRNVLSKIGFLEFGVEKCDIDFSVSGTYVSNLFELTDDEINNKFTELELPRR